MTTVVTRRMNRITCEEEERTRQGFVITTHFQFAKDSQDHRRCLNAKVCATGTTTNAPLPSDSSDSGDASEALPVLFELKYGQSATILQINRGWAGGNAPGGYTLNTERGIWVDREDASDREEPGGDNAKPDTIIRGVRLIVRDTRNLLLVKPILDASLRDEARLIMLTTLQYALQRGIEHKFQLEEQEIASERLGENDWLLFWETSEGGAGVLRRLVEDSEALQDVARIAQDLCRDTPHALKRGGFLCALPTGVPTTSHLPRVQGTTHAPLIAEATAGLRYVSGYAQPLSVLPI